MNAYVLLPVNLHFIILVPSSSCYLLCPVLCLAHTKIAADGPVPLFKHNPEILRCEL